MATHRENVRANRNELFRRAAKLGVDMEAERSKPGTNQRTLAFEAGKLVNDQVPRVSREQLQVDDPPSGAFNNVNTSFLLSAPVKGENITVIWGDAGSNDTIPLTRSNANPPANHEFFFSPSTPTVIVVGNAPAANDRLIAVYLVERA